MTRTNVEIAKMVASKGYDFTEALEAYENEYCDPDLYGVE